MQQALVPPAAGAFFDEEEVFDRYGEKTAAGSVNIWVTDPLLLQLDAAVKTVVPASVAPVSEGMRINFSPHVFGSRAVLVFFTGVAVLAWLASMFLSMYALDSGIRVTGCLCDNDKSGGGGNSASGSGNDPHACILWCEWKHTEQYAAWIFGFAAFCIVSVHLVLPRRLKMVWCCSRMASVLTRNRYAEFIDVSNSLTLSPCPLVIFLFFYF